MQISLQEVMFLLLEWFGANFAHRLKKEAQSGHTIWQQFHSYEFSIHLVARKLFSTILVLNCLHVKNFATLLIYWRIIHRMLKYFIFEHATKISCKTFSKTTKNVVLKTQDSHKNNQSCKTQTNAKLVSYIVLNKRDRLLFELKAQ